MTQPRQVKLARQRMVCFLLHRRKGGFVAGALARLGGGRYPDAVFA
jgi:hypothetical protein